MNFKDLNLEEIIGKIKNKETTSTEVFNYFLKRIEKYDKKIKSYNYLNKE
ncbi:hypothetical protein HOG21_05020 [bacterium]|nr:hypothetical protein [bacterium]